MQLVEVLGGHENSLGLRPGGRSFADRLHLLAVVLRGDLPRWFVALWFHLTHGVWSMFQTVGWANDTWYPRLKCIANIVATVIFLGFAAVVLSTFFCPCIAGAC